MNIPYVVSADIELLLRRWAQETCITLPPNTFFQSLRKTFCMHIASIFPCFEFLQEKEFVEELSLLIQKDGVIPLSLDRAYFLSPYTLDVSRVIDSACLDQGLAARDGVSLAEQVRLISQQLPCTEIALVDDVIFSGNHIEQIGKELQRYGIKISHVYAAVGIGKGIRRLRSLGYEVVCVRTFDAVIDEVCERDFYPGTPFSGRLLTGGENIGAPYILPFGLPGKWASIPADHHVSFSRFCLEQTMALFQKIEETSSCIIRVCDLPRGIQGVPKSTDRCVDQLGNLLENHPLIRR